MPPATPDTHADKERLRAWARRARAANPTSDAAASARTERALAACAGHDGVALYASLPGEPDTWSLIDALFARGVRVLLPLLAGRRTPAWARYAGSDAVRPGFRGIPEPTGLSLGPDGLAEVTFVWASALLVTPTGARLGTGGGWYDRALTHAQPGAIVGVLVDDPDVVDAVPVEPWDHPVDVIVTPTRTLWTHARGSE